MGRDKAWLELDGVPLVEHVARRLLPLVSDIVFSTNDPQAFDTLIARLPVPARVAVRCLPRRGTAGGPACRHPGSSP